MAQGYRKLEQRSLLGVLMGLLLLTGLPIQVQASAPTATAQPSVTASTFPTVSPSPTLIPVVSPINLTLSPVSLSLETDPGVPAHAALKIRNNSETAEQLHLTFGTFTADSTGQRPKLLDPKPGDTYMSWLTADPSNFTIQPGEWQTVNLTFAPPTDAALAYYYSVIVSRTAQLAKPGEAVVQGSPAILVLTNVRSPNAKRQLELASFAAKWPFLEYLPQTFEVAVKNTGNVHGVPTGNIFIDGQNQKDLAVLSINPANSTVLPQSTRTLEVNWEDGFPVRKLNQAEAADPTHPAAGAQFGGASWDFSKADKLRFGKYTAHLLMVYDNGERDVPIESFVSFWVIPWKLILIGLAIVCLAGLGLRSALIGIWQWLTKKLSFKKA